MADRTISVILRAQVDDFTREMGKASKSLDDLVKREDKHATAAQTTAGRIVQSARLQSDAWTTVGSTMLTAGAGITAMNVAVAATGIQYNTLQQTSRAALSAILGGAEKANAQMDKLDAFARTSPFSKSVFIQAQQQMLGFGIEAQKVVPYLTAINEAVAATGGSNQDISELTRIFSQVQASAKITATDLMQFGQRGVDAASLIGSQMGKTGAQIREEITAGTLDAGVALDALAAGMQSRFEGASEGVKNTMAGALDRIQAAWRDLSSAMMESAVSTGGGGFLVDAANGVADFIRLIEGLPAPIRDAGFALSSMAGISLTAFGAFAMGLPRIIETVAAFRNLGTTLPALATGMRLLGTATLSAFGFVGIAAAAAALSMGAMAERQAEAQARADSFTQAMDGQTNALNANVRAVAAKQLQDAGAYDAAKTLGLSLNLVTDAALGNESALARVNAEMALQKAAATDAVTAATQHGESLTEVGGKLGEVNSASHDMNKALGMTSEAFDAAKAANEDMSAATGSTASAMERQAAAALKSMAALQALGNAQLALSGSALGVEAAIRNATEAVKKNGEGLDITTEAGHANRTALDQVAASALAMRDNQMKANVSSAEMDAAMSRNRASFIETAIRMGMNAAEASFLADSYGLIPGSVSTTVSAPGAVASAEQVADLRAKIDTLPPEKRAEIAAIFMTQGYEAAYARWKSITSKTERVAVLYTSSGNVSTAGGITRAYGGPLPGHATHDRADNVIYAGTPGEWVIQRPTTRKYGQQIMADFNAGRFDKSDLMRLQGLAYGGEVGSWQQYRSGMQPARYASSLAPTKSAESGVTPDMLRSALSGAELRLTGAVDTIGDAVAGKILLAYEGAV